MVSRWRATVRKGQRELAGAPRLLFMVVVVIIMMLVAVALILACLLFIVIMIMAVGLIENGLAVPKAAS